MEMSPIKILFLPNFPVSRIDIDEPSILSSNKMVKGSRYWFFNYVDEAEVEVLDNVSPEPFGWLSRNLKFELFQPLVALIRQNNYDMVISHSFNAGFVFAFLRSLFNVNRPRHFIIDVGSLNGGRENRLQILAVRFALRSVAGLIYHSTSNERFYSKYFPTANREFVPFGIDPQVFRPLDHKAKDDFVLSIGATKRDYVTLLKAWKRIDFPLKIVGSEIPRREERPGIQLIDRVRIDELMTMIHDSKFVVLPLKDAKYSVGQMTLLQCMSMGKAVVVTEVHGVRDYCMDGINCLTVGVANEADIVEKSSILLRRSGETERIGTKAREIVSTRFTERDMALRIWGFIKKTFSDRH